MFWNPYCINIYMILIMRSTFNNLLEMGWYLDYIKGDLEEVVTCVLQKYKKITFKNITISKLNNRYSSK